MKTKLLFYLIFSIVMIQAFALSAIAASPAPKTIPIGAIVSLTGIFSSLGNQAKAGYEIAAEEMNRTGGVFVREYGKKIPLEVIVQDTESSPTKAISRMEWLYTEKKVVAYVGEGVMVNGQGVAEKNKIPAIIVAAPHQSPHERGLRYWFSPAPKSPDIARFVYDILDSIPADKRPKTVAIFQENTDWGTEMAEYFKKETGQRAYKAVVHEKYSQMTRDWSQMILSAKNAGAEVVLSSPITPDAMLMMRQIKELDYNPKALVIIRGAEDVSWGKALGPIGDYVIRSGPSWHYTAKTPNSDRLDAAHQAKFGRHADITTGPGYASIQILAAAIEKAGTLDTTKIRDAMLAIDIMTVGGRVKFHPNGTAVYPGPESIQWQKGVEKLIWPKEFIENLVYPIPPWKER
jgi:branched-chain amino acid transport system substrate-binding protein